MRTWDFLLPRWRGLVIVLSGCSLIAGSASADRLRLDGERVIDAIILATAPETVTFEIDGKGVWTLSRKGIRGIDRESKGEYWLRLGRQYRESGDNVRARNAFEQALESRVVRSEAENELVTLGVLPAAFSRSTSRQGSSPSKAALFLETIRVESEEPASNTLSESAKHDAVATQSWTERQGRAIARRYARRYGLDPLLLQAVISVESTWNPRAVSASGAQGLMQLMPSTAVSLGVTNPWNPEDNIRGGARYLAKLIHEFGDMSQDFDDWAPGIAAYNIGPGALRDAGNYGQVPKAAHYVRKVRKAYFRLLNQRHREVAYVVGDYASSVK